jgi:hypothetical protein
MKNKVYIHFHLWLIPFFLNFHKYFELSIQFKSELCEWFDFSFRYRGKQDHAGLYFTFSVLKLIFVEWSIYDNRHWDYEKGCFQSEAMQYSNACQLRTCKFNGFNSDFLWDDAKGCLRDAKYMRARVLNSFGKYRKCPGDHNADFVHQRIGEHFREVDGSLWEMEEWLEKLLGK